MFAKRIKSLIELKAPSIVLQAEKCMLIDCIVLYKTNAVGEFLVNKKMKVIFLDVDGVLNTPSSESRCGEYIGIDDDKTKLLADIVKRMNAEIVLVSTWKKYWRKEEKLKPLQDYSATYLDEKLKKFGIKATDKIKDKSDGKYLSRGEGILEYIVRNKVEKYVILDDFQFDYDGCGLTGCFIKTKQAEGLTKEQSERACKILSEQL